jgi:hypothetical protein
LVAANVWVYGSWQYIRVFACGRCGFAGGDDDAEGAQILQRDLYWPFIMFQSMFGPNYSVWDIRNAEGERVLDDPSTKLTENRKML